MKSFNFTLIKLTFFLIIGIIVGYYSKTSVKLSLIITFIFFITLSILFYISKKQFTKNIWFGLLSYFLMISIGILTVNLHNQKNFKTHYSNNISINPDSTKTITFRVRELLKSNSYCNKYVVNVLNINNNNTTGKLLLNILKDSVIKPLSVDDVFICKTRLKNIRPPLNPEQFDYSNYLSKKYIYHQIAISHQHLFKIESSSFSVYGMASNIRDYINLKLQSHDFKPNELAIINALFLGGRQDISEDIYTNYKNAGIIHILAISGLHIGVIFILLSLVFKPLEQLKNGNQIKTILIVLMLWCFALIAGLSASVTRAVTMFSVIAIAMNLKRPTNIFNTLAISIFILLLVKPMFLFDVGFQLSYMAVLAIVIINPLLHKLWKPKNKILAFYWQTLTITFAAQIGVLPLTLYYFHQIPGLFFISNLVITPHLLIILSFGFIVIFLASLSILPRFLANLFGYTIHLMNTFVEWISNQHYFIIKDISFSLVYVLTTYLFIAFLVNFWKQKNYTSFKWVLIGIIILQCSMTFTNYQRHKNQFIIFHKSGFSLIGHISHNKINVAHNFDSITQSNNHIISNLMIKNIETDSLKNFYTFNKKNLFIIDKLSVWNIRSFQPDYVLLRESPKLNLNRLIDSIKPKQIIADGSNYKSYLKHWEAICKKRKLPFHQTGKKGAFIINY